MPMTERMQRFLLLAAEDVRLRTTHVAVYLSLCAMAPERGDGWVALSRRQVMRATKIRGLATYHRCMFELHALGYIVYLPSYHPIKGSVVRFNDLTC